MRRLRVAVDGSVLNRAAGGARRYAAELLSALAALDAPLDLTVLGVGDATLPHGVARAGAPGPRNNVARTVWTVARGARRVGADVLHAPAYTAPLWGTPPVVLTIHDVSYARHPDWYPARLDPLRRQFFRLSAVRAARIVTDSEFSKREILAAYGIPAERIRVVPLGVAAIFGPGAPPDPTRPYVLHVGELHARRNLPAILEAVVRCRASVPALSELRLVTIGADRGGLADLRLHARRLGGDAALEIRGLVDEERLLEAYRGAAALAYASSYEGFGLPLLEAMACGTPVIAVPAGPVVEVVGDAALLAPSGAPADLAAALQAVLTNPARATALRTAGPERAARFTWRATAEQTLAVYQEAASRG